MLRFFFFKQKTAYEMRISDWSSDVCSSDLLASLIAASTDSPPVERNIDRGSPGSKSASAAARSTTGLEIIMLKIWSSRPAASRNASTRSGCACPSTELICTAVKSRTLRPDESYSHQLRRAHVCTPVTNAPLVSRLMIEDNTKYHQRKIIRNRH